MFNCPICNNQMLTWGNANNKFSCNSKIPFTHKYSISIMNEYWIDWLIIDSIAVKNIYVPEYKYYLFIVDKYYKLISSYDGYFHFSPQSASKLKNLVIYS